MLIEHVESLALRPKEAAKALGIGARTLWAMTSPRGPIPCVRIGTGKRQTVLYPKADIQTWLSREAEMAKGAANAR
ncbi:helix-turn-helix domain-containing protein [Planctopirus hydrillae]|nr:helix-turn-helix domain-containing protein [Planctopirus hydrillae]